MPKTLKLTRYPNNISHNNTTPTKLYIKPVNKINFSDKPLSYFLSHGYPPQDKPPLLQVSYVKISPNVNINVNHIEALLLNKKTINYLQKIHP